MPALLTPPDDLIDVEPDLELSATALLDGPLSVHPPVADRSQLIDQAFSEYKQLVTAGVEVDPDAYCARFPGCQASLRRVMELWRGLEFDSAQLRKLEEALQDWPEVGHDFFGFRLEQALGSGAFARVYLARQPEIGNRRVVLKVTLRTDDERHTLGKLRHPNVLPIHSFRCDEEVTGYTVICMPFLGATTLLPMIDSLAGGKKIPAAASALLDIARDDRLPAVSAAQPARVYRTGTYQDGVLYLAERLASALAYVHDQGIYHRDLKPSNILVCPNGEPVLIDFNLAYDQTLDQHRMGGTMPYMAPEVLEQLKAQDRRGARKDVADHRADVYALGVMIYELLTGAHPFGPVPLKLKTTSARDFLLERHDRGPRPMRALNRSIDPALEAIILRCLSRDPAGRPESAQELADELRRLQKPISRARRWISAHAKLVATVAAFALTGTATGAAYYATLPPPAVAHRQSGANLYRDGKYAEAIEAFTASLALNEDQPAVHFARGRAYQKNGQIENAIEDFKAANPAKDARVAACLGYCLAKNANYLGAAEAYQLAIDSGLKTAETYSGLAYSRCRLPSANDQWAAVTAATQALAINAAFGPAHYNRAVAVLQLALGKHQPDVDLALADMRTAIGQGAQTKNAYNIAAELCALAINDDDPDSMLEAEGAQYVRRAVESGYSGDRIGKCTGRLHRMAEWGQPFKGRNGAPGRPQGMDEDLRLVEPIAD
jgi:serine/threonine protein kinase